MKNRWVIKVGTGILTRADGKIDTRQIAQLSDQLSLLRKAGEEVVLVSSGAIGSGMQLMKLDKRPKELSELQACATVGQISLMTEYQKRFSKHGLCGAQMLLTYWDLDSRSAYENASRTLELLLKRELFIPIINENDAISGEEIRVGDNDNLSAHVAIMVKATRLVILSNVDGLLDTTKKPAPVIPEVTSLEKTVTSLAEGPGSERSVGGMVTKLQAARLCGDQGIETIIANGRNTDILKQIQSGKFVGTRFRLKRSRKA